MQYSYNATVESVKDITPEIKLFSISFKDGHKFNFKAGQFAVLALPDDKNNLDGTWYPRAYSITSAPSQDLVEFYIVLVKEGKLTPRLFELKSGDSIYMKEQPAGLMNFDSVKDDANLLFISTGTGIAPFIKGLPGLWAKYISMSAQITGLKQKNKIVYFVAL